MDGHIRFDTKDCALLLLDQRRLPLAEETFACRTMDNVVVDCFVLTSVTSKGEDWCILETGLWLIGIMSFNTPTAHLSADSFIFCISRAQ